MGDAWPSILFNLCVGLILAGWLMHRVRRFERCADRILERMDRIHEENMRKYDIARDEIRASMRAQVDATIAELTQWTQDAIEPPTVRVEQQKTLGAALDHADNMPPPHVHG